MGSGAKSKKLCVVQAYKLLQVSLLRIAYRVQTLPGPFARFTIPPFRLSKTKVPRTYVLSTTPIIGTWCNGVSCVERSGGAGRLC